MIEIIGYLAIYLVVGWVLSPINKSMTEHHGTEKGSASTTRHLFIVVWPLALILVILVVWIDGLD